METHFGSEMESVKQELLIVKDKLAVLEKKKTTLASKRLTLELALCRMQELASKREFELREKKMESQVDFPWPESKARVTTDTLRAVTLSLIHKIVKEKYSSVLAPGQERLIFYTGGGEFGREMNLSNEEYKECAIQKIITDSCRYCHSLWHTKKDCPSLKTKKCTLCHESGHDFYHCSRSPKDVYHRPGYRRQRKFGFGT